MYIHGAIANHPKPQPKQKGVIGMKVPKIIEEQQRAFLELLERDDSPCVTAKDLAVLWGVDVDIIRAAAEHGTLPFGFGGRQGPHSSRFCRIPKLPLYNWMTQAALYRDLGE